MTAPMPIPVPYLCIRLSLNVATRMYRTMPTYV